ncbi:MAG: small multi-drug export protein [Methanolinea sp.]|nr:small multi-drug export protein [Methanolinea sp.]
MRTGVQVPESPLPVDHPVAKVILPFLLGGLYFGFCVLLLPRETALLLGALMLAYVVPPAGKESVIPLGIALGLPWWLIGTSIALMDVLAGLFMALNFEVAFRVPLLGAWIERFLGRGNDYLARRPWLARFCFAGVVLFVMFPLQGSGGIGATLLGRLLGMGRWDIFFAIVLGAFLGCFLIALGSAFVWEIIVANPATGVTVAAAIIATFVAAYLAYRWRIARGTGQDRK